MLHFELTFPSKDAMFPRNDPNLPVNTRLNNFVEFGMLNRSDVAFQVLQSSLNIQHVHYNLFADHSFKVKAHIFSTKKNVQCVDNFFQNSEFAQVLKANLSELTQRSWVCLYFNLEPRENESALALYNNKKKIFSKSDRFQIFIYMSDKVKYFFQPPNYWDNLPYRKIIDQYFGYLTDDITTTIHGIPYNAYAYTSSPFYTAPYFILLKTNHAIEKNFLQFESFFNPNLEQSVLVLLNFDDETDKFVPKYTSGIVLPYSQTFLDNNLEFTLVDSQQKQVEVNDLSQLFVSLSVI